MPTAPKLIAAVLFAVLAYFVSDLYKPLLPEGTQVGLLSPVNALIGAFFGWTVMGRRAGDTMRAAFGYGLTTMAVIVFWSLLVWSAYIMVRRSTRLYYDGPIHALQDMFSLMVSHAVLGATWEVIGSLVVGSLVFGWLTEQVARHSA